MRSSAKLNRAWSTAQGCGEMYLIDWNRTCRIGEANGDT